MNTYADTLIDSILDGSMPLESIEPDKELVKMGLAFARDHIVMQEDADAGLSVDIEAGLLDDTEGVSPGDGED